VAVEIIRRSQGESQRQKMKLWCDNKFAISIVNNSMQHDKTKHMEIDKFFIKEQLESGLLELSHVATENLAD
jgi:hypothetical protein